MDVPDVPSKGATLSALVGAARGRAVEFVAPLGDDHHLAEVDDFGGLGSIGLFHCLITMSVSALVASLPSNIPRCFVLKADALSSG